MGTGRDRRPRRSRGLAAVALLAACCVAGVLTTSPLTAAAKRSGRHGACQRFAAPFGSDSAAGTYFAPFASVRRLDESLRPGMVGCLMGGTYGSVTTESVLAASGAPGAPVTIRPYPGQRAKLIGWVVIDGSWTTLSHLQIDGSNTFYEQVRAGTDCPAPVSQGLTIDGEHDVLEFSDYYQSVRSLRGVGIGIGWNGGGDGTVIRFDRIHDVGQCEAYDPLIYLANGLGVRIYHNWLWNDQHGRGVQLYPGPSGAAVFGNVIDHAGCGFVVSDDDGNVAAGNLIFGNIVMNSTGLPWDGQLGTAITDYWGTAPGAGNEFFDNISYNNPGGIAAVSAVVVHNNATARPRFVDAARHDYRLARGSQQRLLAALGWRP